MINSPFKVGMPNSSRLIMPTVIITTVAMFPRGDQVCSLSMRKIPDHFRLELPYSIFSFVIQYEKTLFLDSTCEFSGRYMYAS